MNSYNSCDLHIADSHNHLHFHHFNEDRADVVKRSLDAGVRTMLLVGIDPEDSLRALNAAKQHDGFYAAVGIHPQLAASYTSKDVHALSAMAQQSAVVGIGETGFDLFRTPETEDRQRSLFAAHIQLAGQLDLPIIIHDREAHEKTIRLMDEQNGWSSGGVFHCFSGDVSLARKVLDEGFYLSIPGVVTYKNAPGLREVVAFCPFDRLLVETDAPYLSPVPCRGKRNDPSYILQTLKEVARIKEVSFAEAARITTGNFLRLFIRTGTSVQDVP